METVFNEPYPNPHGGWIEVICGSMFSGKTEELIRRIRRAEFAKQRVRVFKPSLDTRYGMEAVVSHNSVSLASMPITSAKEILTLSGGYDVVGIDEAQFFDAEIVEVANMLANKGQRVIIAGLDMDYNGNPFGPMPYLLAVAEFVTKLHAICVQTGEMAHFSYLKSTDENHAQVILGGAGEYEPLSRSAYIKARRNKIENRLIDMPND